MRNRFCCLIVGLFGLMCAAHLANTDQIITDDFKLLASDGGATDQFGTSVSISDGVAIIGVPNDDDLSPNAGAAYIYSFNGDEWIEEQKLFASDAQEHDQFGYSVSIDGDLVVVGARNHDEVGNNAGSVYVFRFDGTQWNQEQELLASDGEAEDQFGHSVSIDSNNILIGSRYAVTQTVQAGVPTSTGAAYVFSHDGTSWAEHTKLVPSDGEDDDRFGYSVSISGNTALVGSHLHDANGTDSGAAYIYTLTNNTWGNEVKVANGSSGDQFGYSVSLDGDSAILGARLNDDNGTDAGSVYVYYFDSNKGQWLFESQLLAGEGDNNDQFGWSVAIDNSIVIVGVYLDDDNGSASGSSYMYRYEDGGWVEVTKFLASDGVASDQFGWFVAIDGNTTIFGSRLDDDSGSNSGSAYIIDVGDDDEDGIFNGSDNCELYNPEQYDYNENGIGDTCEIADGSIADCNDNGIWDWWEIWIGWAEDCNDNSVPDECDIDEGTSQDVNGNEVPDDCEVDCNNNSVPDDWDLSTGYSEDCNDNIVPDECDISDGVSEDVDSNSIPDECEPDCNGNNIPDHWDIATGGSEDCNSDEIPDECNIEDGTSQDEDSDNIPDECEVDCDGNGIPDHYEIKLGWATDCNGNNIPDNCDIADGVSIDIDEDFIPDECEEDCDLNSIPDHYELETGMSSDCNANNVPDHCDINIDFTSLDVNGNGIPDECEIDCNANNIPDDFDLSEGTSQDCNNNLVPDECDIADTTSTDINDNGIPDECEEDCNGNGIPDDYDISTGSSEDCDSNALPDECELADGSSTDCNNNDIPDHCDIETG